MKDSFHLVIYEIVYHIFWKNYILKSGLNEELTLNGGTGQRIYKQYTTYLEHKSLYKKNGKKNYNIKFAKPIRHEIQKRSNV